MFKSTLTGDYVHIYSKDPALDTDSEEFDHLKWIETTDAKYLPEKNGAQAVQFTLRRLNPFERQHLYDVGELQPDGTFKKPSTMFVWAVALALRKIDPLLLDGKKAELGAGTREGFRVLSDEWIERIQSIDDGRMFGELAGRVIREGAGSSRD